MSSDNFSPNEDPEERKDCCILFISAIQETSIDNVSPRSKSEVNSNKLPIKLSGIINIEETVEPTKPPPS